MTSTEEEALIEALQLRTEISELVIGIFKTGKHSMGTLEEVQDNLRISCSRALLSEELDQLKSVVNSLDENYDLVIRKKIQKETMSKSRSFGLSFLDMFSANNVYRGKTPEQIGAILQTYPGLINCCLTGSIKALYFTVSTMENNENISIEEIEEFKKRLEIHLFGGS
jgi:hypothetical protein